MSKVGSEQVVIEDIGEHELSVRVHGFGHLEVLLAAEIHVPGVFIIAAKTVSALTDWAAAPRTCQS